MTINISMSQKNDMLLHAISEIKNLLSQFTNAIITSNGDHIISLNIDAAMKEHCYSLSGDGKKLTINGGSPSAVLCGVYEAFTDAGVFFEPNGCSAPCGFDYDIFFNINKSVHPKCRYRGIRQHINFPMDISSYTLKEAKEYIRNIARMRYNAITFHSYGGQWHVVNLDDHNAHSGNFFYGQRHPVPADTQTASVINNKKYYCIPEIESEYDNPPVRQELAEYWLREIMSEAKKAYMTISFSVEPVIAETDKFTEMVLKVIETYPDIDILEILSPECAGNLKIEEMTADNLVDITVDMFGNDVLNADGTLDGFMGYCPGSYGGAILSLKRALDLYSSLKKHTAKLPKVPELRMGMYMTDENVNNIMLPMMRKLVPTDVTLSFLPCHGALAVANTIKGMNPSEPDWQRTMWYSWAEFDGNMYIQQLATDGMEALISQIEADDVYGISVNHWRTAENMLPLVYDSIAMITPIDTYTFYKQFAKKLGIGNVDLFASVCDRLAKLDTLCRDSLFNIGFCYVGCWYRRSNGITRPRKYSSSALMAAADKFTELVADYTKLLPVTAVGAGSNYIRLMINRCTTTILHLCSMNELALVKDMMIEYTDYIITNGKLPEIPEENNIRIRKAYENTIYYAKKYVSTYAEILPDRGGEGQIVSYVETVPVYTKELFKPFIDDIETAGIVDEFDAPPLPDSVSI